MNKETSVPRVTKKKDYDKLAVIEMMYGKDFGVDSLEPTLTNLKRAGYPSLEKLLRHG